MRRCEPQTPMDVMEAMRTRRSIGKVTGDVSDAEVRALVDVALCAPNHKQTAPWTFTVLRGDARARLGDAWARIAADITSLTGDDRDAFLSREARKPLRAPVLIVTSTVTALDPVTAAEDFAATAAATQNLLLAAHALGLGAVWRTGDIAYRSEINAVLGLAPNDRIVGIVYIGRPDMRVPPEPPRDVDAALRILT